MDAPLIKIVPFEESHLTALRELFLREGESTFSWEDQPVIQLDDFDRETEGGFVLTAVSGDIVIGFVSVWPPDRFIHHLYVSPSLSGHG